MSCFNIFPSLFLSLFTPSSLRLSRPPSLWIVMRLYLIPSPTVTQLPSRNPRAHYAPIEGIISLRQFDVQLFCITIIRITVMHLILLHVNTKVAPTHSLRRTGPGWAWYTNGSSSSCIALVKGIAELTGGACEQLTLDLRFISWSLFTCLVSGGGREMWQNPFRESVFKRTKANLKWDFLEIRTVEKGEAVLSSSRIYLTVPNLRRKT